jgi:hypothetical protein
MQKPTKEPNKPLRPMSVIYGHSKVNERPGPKVRWIIGCRVDTSLEPAGHLTASSVQLRRMLRVPSEPRLVLTDQSADVSRHSFEHVTYTSLWNLSDQSVAIFPVTYANLDDIKPASYEARNAVEQRIWDRCECILIGGVKRWRS